MKSSVQASESIGAIASRGIFWSLVQNWGSKVFTFVLFVLLARFLSPAEYGLASAALSVLTLIGLVAEFGFGDAILQRPGLRPYEVNLPFLASMLTSTALAIVAMAGAGLLEGWLNSPGLAPVIMVAAPIAPLTALSLFQEVSYRRQLSFRLLAGRVLIATLVAGTVAVVSAMLGAGVYSLIIQSYVSVFVSIVWLWMRPVWVPGRRFDRASFVQMGRFGASVVSMRLLDFAATKVIELIIIGRYGIAVLGLYAVGSRLYQVLMQLLQSALNDVSLTVLSRIASERERMAAIYLQATTIAAYVAAPVFVASAAMAPEICHFLFDAKWVGVEAVARPLLLLGAIQSVQYLNGAYLSARGRPNVVLAIASIKYAGMIAGLLLIPTEGVSALVLVFVLLQLVATPLSFEAVRRELGLKWSRVVLAFLPAVLACGAGYGAVTLARPWLGTLGPFLAIMALSVVFVVGFAVIVALFGRAQVRQMYEFVGARLRERRGASRDGGTIVESNVT